MLFGKKIGHPLKSWINPKAKKGQASHIAERGLLALAGISKDEVIVIKAGRIIDKKTLDANEKIIRGSQAQITDEMFIAPLTPSEFDDSMAYVNHSCQPNAGFGGNILVVAMRDIKPGEEITIDYAMQWADPTLRLSGCNCNNQSCRKVVSGDDWKNPQLQKKYAGYFSWYIEQKIKALP